MLYVVQAINIGNRKRESFIRRYWN